MKSEIDCPLYFRCHTCYNYVDEPIECSHCKILFCSSCISNNNTEYCVGCGQPANFTKSSFTRLLVSNVPLYCVNGCGATLTTGEAKSHERVCHKKSNSFFTSNISNHSRGKNGIYYCGRALGFACGCCDGFCGPTNGCCCSMCMIYNCEMRALPSNTLINNRGYDAKLFGSEFACGAVVTMKGVNVACTSAYPCESCRVLKTLKNKRIYTLNKESHRLK